MALKQKQQAATSKQPNGELLNKVQRPNDFLNALNISSSLVFCLLQ